MVEASVGKTHPTQQFRDQEGSPRQALQLKGRHVQVHQPGEEALFPVGSRQQHSTAE